MAGQIPLDSNALANLCRRRHIRRLALFGSIVRGELGPTSDVDVLVEFEPGVVIGWEVADIEDELSALFGGRRIDLVSARWLNPRLRESILAEAVTQYAA